MIDVLKNQWKYRYALPYTKKITLLNFIEFVLGSYDGYKNIATSSQDKRFKLLECDVCWTFNAITKESISNKLPNSLIEYYDVYNFLNSSSRKKFNYNASKENFLNDVEGYVNACHDLSLNVSKHDSLNKSKEDHIRIFRLSSYIDRINTCLEVAEWSYSTNNDGEMADIVTYIMEELDYIYSVFCDAVDNHKYNIINGLGEMV